MYLLIPVLRFLFFALEFLAMLVVAPLAFICGLGLMAFTFEICHMLKTEKRSSLRSLSKAYNLDWSKA